MTQQTTPIKLELTPFGALQLLVNRVNEIKGSWTESLDNAMQTAEEVIQHETENLMRLALPLPEKLSSCAQLLEHARDSQVSVLALLQSANKHKQCGGLASLLLLDMIREAATMAERIRAILAAASSDAEEKFHIWCAGDGSWMTSNPRVFTLDKTRRGHWNREVAERLCPSGDYPTGVYRIYPVMTPEGTNPQSLAGCAIQIQAGGPLSRCQPTKGGKGSEAP